jgi:hypothetical protein
MVIDQGNPSAKTEEENDYGKTSVAHEIISHAINNLTRPPPSTNTERIVTNKESDQIAVNKASVSKRSFFL